MTTKALELAQLGSGLTVTSNTATCDGTLDAGNIVVDDKIVHSGDTDTSIRFPAADTVTVETAGAERLRITSAGNVGIGTSSPTQSLDVVGNAVFGKSGTAGQITFRRPFDGIVSGSLGMLDASDNATLTLQQGGSGAIVRLNASNATGVLRFDTNSTERMRIDSSGNVLVGTTTSPTSPSNAAIIVSGGVKSASNLISSAASGVATTAFTITGANRGRYEVIAMIANSGDASQYTAISTILWDGSTGRAVSDNGTKLTITISGADVQVTQTSGSAQNIYWGVQRISI